MTKPSLRGSAGRFHVLADRAGRAAQVAYFAVFDGTRGRGRPLTVDRWDEQWGTGHWDYLLSEDELPRYAVIAGYVRAAATTAAPAVLDVGCGNGHLLTVLGEGVVDSYHGIDMSSEAVSQARDSSFSRATFEVADLTRWEAPSAYDVIVLNEVLYYVTDPVAQVERYLGYLHKPGLLVISMFRHGNTKLIWRTLKQALPVQDAAEVRNRLGEVVDVKVVRPR